MALPAYQYNDPYGAGVDFDKYGALGGVAEHNFFTGYNGPEVPRAPTPQAFTTHPGQTSVAPQVGALDYIGSESAGEEPGDNQAPSFADMADEETGPYDETTGYAATAHNLGQIGKQALGVAMSLPFSVTNPLGVVGFMTNVNPYGIVYDALGLPEDPLGVYNTWNDFANEMGWSDSNTGFGPDNTPDDSGGLGDLGDDTAASTSGDGGYGDGSVSDSGQGGPGGPGGSGSADEGDTGGTNDNGSDSDDESGGACIISTALTAMGDWDRRKKLKAVRWCRNKHHDGTLRGAIWVDGYHCWGAKFVALMKKHPWFKRFGLKISTAYLNQITGEKPSFLGILTWLWVTPLSYIVGGVRKIL